MGAFFSSKERRVVRGESLKTFEMSEMKERARAEAEEVQKEYEELMLLESRRSHFEKWVKVNESQAYSICFFDWLLLMRVRKDFRDAHLSGMFFIHFNYLQTLMSERVCVLEARFVVETGLYREQWWEMDVDAFHMDTTYLGMPVIYYSETWKDYVFWYKGDEIVYPLECGPVEVWRNFSPPYMTNSVKESNIPSEGFDPEDIDFEAVAARFQALMSSGEDSSPAVDPPRKKVQRKRNKVKRFFKRIWKTLTSCCRAQED